MLTIIIATTVANYQVTDYYLLINYYGKILYELRGAAPA
jgi:hypothetical protein